MIACKAVSFTNVITRTVNDANIEDSDEYLNIKATSIHVNIKSKLNCNDRANKIPKYVATPFPPLNFSHKGKRWPKKADKHDK